MYGEIAAILTTVSFALSYVLVRKIEDEASPIFQNAIRSIVGFLTFFTICSIFGILLKIFILPVNLTLILIVSILFNIILGDTAYLQSQKMLGPTKALAITTTSPFFTIIFSILFLNRPISIFMIISGILIAIGVIIITKAEVNSIHDEKINVLQSPNSEIKIFDVRKKSFNTLKGTFLAFVAAISWAIGFAISDYGFSQVNDFLDLGILSTMVAMVVRFMFASILLSTIAFMQRKKRPFPKKKKTWKIMIISAILSYSIGSIFFGEAVQRVGASYVSLISTSLPLFTIPFSYIINKEKPSKTGFLGVIVTLVGVVLILF